MLPLLPLLGIGVLAYVAFSASSDSSATSDTSGDNAGDTSPPDDTATDDSGDTATEEAPVVRSSQYDSFMSAYAATPYHNEITSAEQQFGLPENLLARMIYSESAFNPDATHTNKNGSTDIGIAQLNVLPDGTGTAHDLGADPNDASQSIVAAAQYLASLRDTTGSWQAALVAYNWGPANVQKYGARAAPQSVQNYANNIVKDSNA